MAPDVDKRLVASHFHLHAGDYDAVTPVQAAMAVELLERVLRALDGRTPGRILELGCGTGRLTAMLRQAFPDAAITSLDVAPAMVDAARQRLAGEPVDWRVADAEETAGLPGSGPYDLIISNAMLQWLTDPGRLLARCRERLAAGGWLALSTFGPETFRELRASFAAAEEALALPPQSHVMQLPTPDDLAGWLGAATVSRLDVRPYPDVRSFLHSLKLTGATLARTHMAPVPRRLYLRLFDEYARRFPHPGGGIAVTYHQLYCLAGPEAP